MSKNVESHIVKVSGWKNAWIHHFHPIHNQIEWVLFLAHVPSFHQALLKPVQWFLLVVHRCIGRISVAADIRLVYCHRCIDNKLDFHR